MLYTFFDVETPNSHQDRICSIGVVVTDETGKVVEKKYHLVDPECGFSDANMRIHGLSPLDVRGAKTFPELWDESLSSLFPADGVVAHNAPYDLNVMSKTFSGYGIEMPDTNYACTLRMSRNCQSITGGKLPDVCESLGIGMGNHHRADDDADACMRVFWSIVDMEGRIPRFDRYIPSGAKKRICASRSFSDKTKAMQYLLQIIEAAISDGEVSTFEAEAVLEFIDAHEELCSDKALAPIIEVLQIAMVDGWIDEQESCELMTQLSHISDPSSGAKSQVAFEGNIFVLTGTFEHGPNEVVSEFIVEHGGIVADNLTKKSNYVVRGGCGSEAYSFGSYGGKVKKALDWQAKGVPVQIINECDLYA